MEGESKQMDQVAALTVIIRHVIRIYWDWVSFLGLFY